MAGSVWLPLCCHLLLLPLATPNPAMYIVEFEDDTTIITKAVKQFKDAAKRHKDIRLPKDIRLRKEAGKVITKTLNGKDKGDISSL